MNIYETDRLLAEYLLFHYGEAEDVLALGARMQDSLGYPERCVTECIDLRIRSRSRALDLGCAVGRSTFELARSFAEVVGIDYSARFVDAAAAMQRGEEILYERADEGRLTTSLTARAPGGVDLTRVSFERGDAMALRADLGVFDVVLMANLIDRLSDPDRCLAQLPDLVRKGGQLVITSPYTWLEEFTTGSAWLGGYEIEGRRVHTLDGLRSRLDPAFELMATKDLPFLIREHARKYQWGIAQASIWRRR